MILRCNGLDRWWWRHADFSGDRGNFLKAELREGDDEQESIEGFHLVEPVDVQELVLAPHAQCNAVIRGWRRRYFALLALADIVFIITKCDAPARARKA